nr:M1 family metallopeptidase [Allomuricauda sp.]
MRPSPILVLLFISQVLSSQIQERVDFKHADVSVLVKAESKGIEGKAVYQFEVLKDVDSVFLDAKNMDFSETLLNGKPFTPRTSNTHLAIKKRFKKGEQHTLSVSYSCFPQQTVYFLGWDFPNNQSPQIWTQGQGKYSSHWIPSFDDMNEKVEFDLNITFKEGYRVIANGKLEEVKTEKGLSTWHFDMVRPMSSYLLAFAIGRYDKLEKKSSSGIPIELYYEPFDSLRVEPTYRYTKRIFDYLENEIGIPYPWQNYKQIPVHDFLYAGMENTGATIFSNSFVVDSVAFHDKNYVNVNAHELAHQWFGNMVTEQSGDHHWLHEGFATYYAYLAEKEIFGQDYFYWRLWETATSLNNLSSDGNGEALTNPNAGSLTFYEKGAWALVMLREQVGDKAFREGIRNYLENFAFENVTVGDFMWEMRKASGMKLVDFEETWLQESEFPIKKTKAYLKGKSNSMARYFEIQETLADTVQGFEDQLITSWKGLDSDKLKETLLKKYTNRFPNEFLLEILQKESLSVRRALATSIDKVSTELKGPFEKLLEDDSYITKEAVLYRLWTDFPQDQKKYLDITKNIDGIPNKNVHLLWLTLALVTPGYEENLKPKFFKELGNYTDPRFHFEIRLLAFQYLKNLNAFSDETLKNLVKACNHHVWYFKKSSRKLLHDFLKGEGNEARLISIYESLQPDEQQYLDKTLSQ